MAKATDITIDVTANINVDGRTAEACLKLVEIFCNARGLGVASRKDNKGGLIFEFVNSSKPNISQEALDAINAIGKNTHGEE